MGFHRRQLLKAGSVCLALPWLESFAGAGETGPPKRMVSICTSFGLYGPSFFPAKAGRDYEPSEYLQVLGDLRDQFTVFSGISHPEIGGDHASEACFLTSAKHPTARAAFAIRCRSIIVAARHVSGATRFPLLTLSTLESSPLTYTPTGAGVPALGKPSELYAKLFLAGSQSDVQQELARLKQGQSVLDRMADRFFGIETAGQPQRSTAIGRLYRRRARSGEATRGGRGLGDRPKPNVEEPAPSEGYPSPFADRSDTLGRARVMLNMIRLALQTDSTRVVNVVHPRDGREAADRRHFRRSSRTDASRPNPVKIEQLRIVERAEVAVLPRLLGLAARDQGGRRHLLDKRRC